MQKTDLLSEVFSTLRISSDIYFRTRFSGSYAVAIPEEKRRIRFHIVLKGTCWLCMPNGTNILLSEGDIALVPNGVSQKIQAIPELKAINLSELLSNGSLDNGMLKIGSGEDATSLLCGFCQFDETLDHPIVSVLPDFIHLRHEDLQSSPWLITAMKLISLEANLNNQGSTAVINRLIEIILIQTIRQMANDNKQPYNGFLNALLDSSLSKAIFAIHAHPEEKWRVEDLAKLAGMSRASFAKKFQSEIGKPPIDYLRDWRLLHARQLLNNTSDSLDEIATKCGYESLPSFSKLFKRKFKIGPSAYRKLDTNSQMNLD
ncbi:cupin domain-containing protein [Curvivirga sp.]|uniref:AraC family transcriptional regulator n=1 Tax=Curvivirga sp. TaxID=2856848 RepID=UPI003B5B0913